LFYFFLFHRCVKLLLEHGASLSAVNQSGWTPLHVAASNGHSDVCQLLLDHGARIDAVTNVSIGTMNTEMNEFIELANNLVINE